MNILPNLRKALYCRCCWRNQVNQRRWSEQAPEQPTYNNEPFDPNELVTIGDVQITRLEQCQRLGGPDVWTFEVTIVFPASETLTMSGDSAEKLWKAWKGVVFGQTNK